MPSNDLFDFMVATTQGIADEYERIQKRSVEDPGTAGDQGEENWATLLRGWIPSSYHVVTKGRILSHKGIASPQVDVLVLDPAYPRHLLDKKLYLAGGVAAAFECKLTLRASHIRKAFRNAVEIRSHLPERRGTPYKELYSPIVYGLLAHSHCWKKSESSPLENVENHLVEDCREALQHPREMIDLICVADLATWVPVKLVYMAGKQSQEQVATSYLCFSKEHEQPEGFTAIGVMITNLICRLAWENPELRRLADYFSITGLEGTGGGTGRTWGISVYSEEVREQVTKSDFDSDTEQWNEWSLFL